MLPGPRGHAVAKLGRLHWVRGPGSWGSHAPHLRHRASNTPWPRSRALPSPLPQLPVGDPTLGDAAVPGKSQAVSSTENVPGDGSASTSGAPAGCAVATRAKMPLFPSIASGGDTMGWTQPMSPFCWLAPGTTFPIALSHGHQAPAMWVGASVGTAGSTGDFYPMLVLGNAG